MGSSRNTLARQARLARQLSNRSVMYGHGARDRASRGCMARCTLISGQIGRSNDLRARPATSVFYYFGQITQRSVRLCKSSGPEVWRLAFPPQSFGAASICTCPGSRSKSYPSPWPSLEVRRRLVPSLVGTAPWRS
jgi:hypothetical protein